MLKSTNHSWIETFIRADSLAFHDHALMVVCPKLPDCSSLFPDEGQVVGMKIWNWLSGDVQPDQ